MSRNQTMTFVVYPIVVAMGAVMLADGNVLLGAIQIAVGLGAFGLRLSMMARGRI